MSGIATLRIDCLCLSWKLQEFLEIQMQEFFNYNSNTNRSSMFYSSLKFLHFGLLNGDGGTTTWTIFMCHLFCFSFSWWDLIGRFIVGTFFSCQIFFPTPNSLLVLLFHFQERKKAQQPCQLYRCHRESPSLNWFHRIYYIIKFFSQYCLPHASKQSFI